MYKDAGSPPCAALFGDIADDAVLPPAVPAPAVPSAAAPAQAPAQGGSVAELAGRCTVVSCTAVLHCLGREQVEALLRKVRVCSRAVQGCVHFPCLLQRAQCMHACPLAFPPRAALQMAVLLAPGGLLLGSTLGAPTPRAWEATYQAGHTRWLHSAESLAGALAAAGYEGVEVAPTSWRVSCSGASHGPFEQVQPDAVEWVAPAAGRHAALGVLTAALPAPAAAHPQDLDQSISSGTMQPLMEQHVGRGLPLEGKLMLAFSAVKPGGSP